VLTGALGAGEPAAATALVLAVAIVRVVSEKALASRAGPNIKQQRMNNTNEDLSMPNLK
jgi:hypothetical protein